jgi:hypothetical protein
MAGVVAVFIPVMEHPHHVFKDSFDGRWLCEIVMVGQIARQIGGSHLSGQGQLAQVIKEAFDFRYNSMAADMVEQDFLITTIKVAADEIRLEEATN